MSSNDTGGMSARRALRLLFALQGHAFDGLRLKQLAEVMNTPTSTTLRDLQLLASEGLAERIPGREDCWRLSPKLAQIARAHDLEMQRLRSRVDEIDQRYTRLP